MVYDFGVKTHLLGPVLDDIISQMIYCSFVEENQWLILGVSLIDHKFVPFNFYINNKHRHNTDFLRGFIS